MSVWVSHGVDRKRQPRKNTFSRGVEGGGGVVYTTGKLWGGDWEYNGCREQNSCRDQNLERWIPEMNGPFEGPKNFG